MTIFLASALFFCAPTDSGKVAPDSSYERLMQYNDTTGTPADRFYERENYNHPGWNPDGSLWPSQYMDSPWEFSRRDWC